MAITKDEVLALSSGSIGTLNDATLKTLEDGTRLAAHNFIGGAPIGTTDAGDDITIVNATDEQLPADIRIAIITMMAEHITQGGAGSQSEKIGDVQKSNSRPTIFTVRPLTQADSVLKRYRKVAII